MINKIYENFSKEKFNQLNNFNMIMTKINSENNSKKIHFLNKAAIIFISLIIFITPIIYAQIQWNIQFKKYQNREYEIGYATLESVNKSGYIENINMDFITPTDIGVKVNSLLIVNDYLEIKLNFKFKENIEIDTENFSYGYAIYDENNNIYGILPRTNIINPKSFTNYTKNLYHELNVNYDPLDIFSVQLNNGSEIQNISAQDNIITSKITMDGKDTFPKSSKLFVRIFDLGFYTYNESERLNSDFNLSNDEWIFELNIPNRFYLKNNVELYPQNDIPEIKIKNISVDTIRTKINFEWDNYDNYILNNNANSINELLYLTDDSDNIYFMTTGNSNNNSITRYFEINNSMLNKKYFINVKINNTIHTSELIIK